MFSCGFTGHRKIPQTEIAILYQHVQAAIKFSIQQGRFHGNCRKAVPFLAVVWYSNTNEIKGGPSGVRGGMEGSVDQFEEFYCDRHGDFMCAYFGIFDFCVVAIPQQLAHDPDRS